MGKAPAQAQVGEEAGQGVGNHPRLDKLLLRKLDELHRFHAGRLSRPFSPTVQDRNLPKPTRKKRWASVSALHRADTGARQDSGM